jgi:AbrB family looped-hinge helix DNA binding protein
MATMKTVTVSGSGRLTLPAEVRRELGLEGETELEVVVDVESDEIILRPAVVLRREDAWAYTPSTVIFSLERPRRFPGGTGSSGRRG